MGKFRNLWQLDINYEDEALGKGPRLQLFELLLVMRILEKVKIPFTHGREHALDFWITGFLFNWIGFDQRKNCCYLHA